MSLLQQDLRQNPYPGRGLILGRTVDGKRAALAYFLMGRSENSRNRILVEEGDGIRTEAFDPSKMTDPSLIIYRPVRVMGNKTIVSNGDQTDTIYDLMNRQYTFEQALRTREFEPDAPNFTPRISGILRLCGGGCNYAISILKSADGDPSSCRRFVFCYSDPRPGEGHYIHTYQEDGDPLPSFAGEPKEVFIPDDMSAFGDEIWESLNAENKVALFVRYIELSTGKTASKIYNKLA